MDKFNTLSDAIYIICICFSLASLFLSIANIIRVNKAEKELDEEIERILHTDDDEKG